MHTITCVGIKDVNKVMNVVPEDGRIRVNSAELGEGRAFDLLIEAIEKLMIAGQLPDEERTLSIAQVCVTDSEAITITFLSPAETAAAAALIYWGRDPRFAYALASRDSFAALPYVEHDRRENTHYEPPTGWADAGIVRVAGELWSIVADHCARMTRPIDLLDVCTSSVAVLVDGRLAFADPIYAVAQVVSDWSPPTPSRARSPEETRFMEKLRADYASKFSGSNAPTMEDC